MTFPSPFDTPEPPGADQAFALQAEHGQAIQAIADRLYQAGAEAQKKLKTTLATGIKGKLVRPAAREQKANSQERTRIAAQMRHDGEIAQADNDAEIMRLAPRLGAYEAEAALMQPAPLPPIPRPPVPPGVPPTGYGFWECPNPGLQWPNVWAWHETYDPNRPPTDPPPGGDPAGHARQVEQLGGRFGWWNPDGMLASCQATGLPPPTILPPPIPPPVVIPPGGPPPCPPCPPARCTPDGIPLLGPPLCPQGPPPDAQKVAVYVVPWLEPGDTVPSVWSECGQKLIDDSLYRLYPAQATVDEFATPGGYNAYWSERLSQPDATIRS